MPAVRSATMLAASVAAVALAGCGSVEKTMLERGFPPVYAEGCASSKARGLFAEARRDERRYDSDSQYTRGWDEGFEECRRDMARMVLNARLRNPNRDD